MKKTITKIKNMLEGIKEDQRKKRVSNDLKKRIMDSEKQTEGFRGEGVVEWDSLVMGSKEGPIAWCTGVIRK